MFELDKVVRDNIKKLTPYSSARNEFRGEEGTFLDANENPFGRYNRYPDPYQNELKKALTEVKNVKAKNIFLGNGSDEVIDLLFRIFCNPKEDKVLTFLPTYGMYQVSAEINDVELIDVALNKKFQIDLERVKPFLNDKDLKLIFICSPNNPTGNSINENDIKLLLNRFNGIVVIDEAYIDFSSENSWSELIDEYPNLVVLQTLSKAWGLAGVRLGLALANSKIISYLNKVKPPYNISKVNQEIALVTIQSTVLFEEKKQVILAEKIRLEKGLNELNLVEMIYPSDANFFLVKVNDSDRLYEQLIKRKLIVRNRNGEVKNCLRITVGSPEENTLLINELKKLDNAKSTIYR